jgi:3-deoxy-7-phosphoheptulonate synthase
MLVVMKAEATPEQIQGVCQAVEELGFRAHPLGGSPRAAIGITGNQGEEELEKLKALSGVAEVTRLLKPYKLASREAKHEDTVLQFAAAGSCPEAAIGGRTLAIFAGPGALKGREQAFALAEQEALTGAQFFRCGGFEGVGQSEALDILTGIRSRFGLRLVAEVNDSRGLDAAAEWADILQIGAQNMQNYALLKRAGRLRKPVIVTRGLSATLEEFLMAAEYGLSEGNYKVILCESGVRGFADHARNTLDLSVIPAVKRLSHLPILVDPGHATGRRDSVLPMARAAVAAGADGVLVEVGSQTETALTDGLSSIDLAQFARMMDELEEIAPVVGRCIVRRI